LPTSDLSAAPWAWSRTGRGEFVTSTQISGDGTDGTFDVRVVSFDAPVGGTFVLSGEFKAGTNGAVGLGFKAPSTYVHDELVDLTGAGQGRIWANDLGATLSQTLLADGYYRVTLTGQADPGPWVVWVGISEWTAGSLFYRNLSFTVGAAGTSPPPSPPPAPPPSPPPAPPPSPPPAPPPSTTGFWKTPISALGINGGDGAVYPHVNYKYPSSAWFAWLRTIGVNHARVSFRIEALEPTVGGALDAGQVSAMRAMLDAAQANGVVVNLNAHNFGHRDVSGTDIYYTDSRLPGSALAEFWRKMAVQFGTHPALMAYGLMNEPPWDLPLWADACTQCVQAIRSVDARTPILIPRRGAWVWDWKPDFTHDDDLLAIPGNYLAIEGHQYADNDSSGRFGMPAEDWFNQLTQWMGAGNETTFLGALTTQFANTIAQKGNGKRTYLGETGIPSMMMWLDDTWKSHWDSRTWWVDMIENAVKMNSAVGMPMMLWISGEHAEGNKLFCGSHVTPSTVVDPTQVMIKRVLAGLPLIT
jgi:hypothetical protein